MKSKESEEEEREPFVNPKKVIYCKCSEPKACKYYDENIKTNDELPNKYTCSKCKAKPMHTAAGSYYCLNCRFFECLNCAGHYKVENNPKCLICNEHLQIHDLESMKQTLLEKYKCQNCKKTPDLDETNENVSNFYFCKECKIVLCKNKECTGEKFEQLCEKKHFMHYIDFSPAFANIREYYKCDICDEPNFTSKFKRYACINCIYNICRRCKPLPKFGEKLEISKEEKSSNIKESKIFENSNQAKSSDKAESHEIKNKEEKKEQKSQIEEIKS